MRYEYDGHLAGYNRYAAHDYVDSADNDDSSHDEQSLEDMYNGLDHKSRTVFRLTAWPNPHLK